MCLMFFHLSSGLFKEGESVEILVEARCGQFAEFGLVFPPFEHMLPGRGKEY